MDASFWHQKWEENDLGFHQSAANRMLVAHLADLSLTAGDRIFLPLCGKTLDIAWLMSQGYRIAGAELSEVAIGQLFEQLDIAPEISELGKLKRYSADNIDIFVGDFFDVTKAMLGPVAAIYDRAALVALPEDMRRSYRKHLLDITNEAPQLLLTFDYDQKLMEGPPFSINVEDVHQYYQDRYDVSLLGSKDIPGGLKGFCPAMENAWLLR
jgi:thiopurine S-methyltransferase